VSRCSQYVFFPRIGPGSRNGFPGFLLVCTWLPGFSHPALLISSSPPEKRAPCGDAEVTIFPPQADLSVCSAPFLPRSKSLCPFFQNDRPPSEQSLPLIEFKAPRPLVILLCLRKSRDPRRLFPKTRVFFSPLCRFLAEFFAKTQGFSEPAVVCAAPTQLRTLSLSLERVPVPPPQIDSSSPPPLTSMSGRKRNIPKWYPVFFLSHELRPQAPATTDPFPF